MMIHILFSSAGRRVALIECFREAAKELRLGLEVVAIDMEPEWSPACATADYSYRVSRCTSNAFIEEVLNICKKHKVNLIIPTIDNELMPFAKNRALFEKENIELHLSELKVIKVARDKKVTTEILRSNSIPSPSTWNVNEIVRKKIGFRIPLIAKPVDGSSSKGIKIVRSQTELMKITESPDQYVIQELLKGREFTINCFFDEVKGCVSCVPHYRKLIRDGEVCFAETVRVPLFKTYADRLFNALQGIYGSICFQGFLDEKGHASVFEINARFGGGYPICNKAGGTYAKWLIQKIIGEPPKYNDQWLEGIRMLRYDAAIYSTIEKHALCIRP
jgi:carbamoyl-phosphate synthase large subunit